jgi:hypothetical protein
MTAEQALEIRKKFPSLSIEENWYRIWRILLPESMPPDSPCEAPTDLSPSRKGIKH